MTTESLNVGIAFLAGILTFVSPCVLPLIPSYIAVIAGASLQDLKDSSRKRLAAFKNTVFFVVGFSIVFITLGVLFTATFGLFAGIGQILNIIAGFIVILLGLHFIFDFWKILNLEKRYHPKDKPTGILGSFLLGIAFGAGWSPCVGPILGSILLLAGTTGKMLQGLSLLFVFSMGLGLPFLLTGLFFSSALRQLNKLKAHLAAFRTISGVFLIVIGILILLGRLQRLNIILAVFSQALYTWDQANPLLSRLIFGALFLLVGLLIFVFYVKRVGSEKVLANGEDGGEKDRGVSSVKVIRPLRIFFIILCVVASVLTLTGTIDVASYLATWFSFQGL
jgi:cytochrome c-type biogenesis protein